jgi:Flp pilus assembly protein TadG
MHDLHAPRTRRADRGAAAVEMAIVLPLLFLVIAGIIDFGRYFFEQIQLSNAAREGARAAVVSTASLADIESRAAAAAGAVSGLQITATLCSGSGGNATVAAASPSFTWILLEPAMNLFGGAGALPTPQSTAVMKCGG